MSKHTELAKNIDENLRGIPPEDRIEVIRQVITQHFTEQGQEVETSVSVGEFFYAQNDAGFFLTGLGDFESSNNNALLFRVKETAEAVANQYNCHVIPAEFINTHLQKIRNLERDFTPSQSLEEMAQEINSILSHALFGYKISKNDYQLAFNGVFDYFAQKVQRNGERMPSEEEIITNYILWLAKRKPVEFACNLNTADIKNYLTQKLKGE